MNAKRFGNVAGWCTLCCGVCTLGSSARASPTVIDDFESGTLSNWNVCYADQGVWEIVSPGHNSNFAATFNDPSTSQGSGTLRHNTFSAGLGRYSFDVFFETTGTSLSDGGLFLHIVNDSDFYYLQLGPQDGDNGDDRMHVIQSGVPTVVGCVPVSLTKGVWHTIAIERFPNGVIRVYLNGVLKIMTFDPTYMGAGGLALRAVIHGVRFDNITFDPTLPPSPSPPGPPSCGGPNGLASPCPGGSPCPNGTCDSYETRCTCPQDCGSPFCGDGTCCTGETHASCPQDCVAGSCGDTVCTPPEDRCTCPQDCGSPACGDGLCCGSETPCTCPEDCGSPFCGDGLCCAGERCTCSSDCGTPFCGDGVCCASAGEDHTTCPGDCPGGACCLSNNGCVPDVTQDGCVKLGGRYMGDGSTECIHTPEGECIPTVSEWGVAVMTMLLLTVGTLVVMRRRLPTRT